MFIAFRRDLAPGVRLTKGAAAYLDRVTFYIMEELRKTQLQRVNDIIEGSAVSAYPGATLSLVVRPQTP